MGLAGRRDETGYVSLQDPAQRRFVPLNSAVKSSPPIAVTPAASAIPT